MRVYIREIRSKRCQIVYKIWWTLAAAILPRISLCNRSRRDHDYIINLLQERTFVLLSSLLGDAKLIWSLSDPTVSLYEAFFLNFCAVRAAPAAAGIALFSCAMFFGCFCYMFIDFVDLIAYECHSDCAALLCPAPSVCNCLPHCVAGRWASWLAGMALGDALFFSVSCVYLGGQITYLFQCCRNVFHF